MAAQALLIFGITGRMGQSLLRAVQQGSQFRLCGAVASAASSRLGLDAAQGTVPSGVMVSADPSAALKQAAVALDFSLSSGVAAHARACAAAKVPILIGATGFDASIHAELKSVAREIPVLIAPNTSIAVAVLRKLVAVATQGLGGAYEVKISEAHHLNKRDAPSGTALSLGEVIAEARGQRLSEVANQQPGQAALQPGSIGFSVVRAGEIVGEHTVSFATAGERLEITHRATDRMIFAHGALRAAAWLIGQPAGLYGMQDVLGF